MLERLAENEYYCFLDGFSGYFQISIDPQDQEKTTFMCPYGTFAYRRVPFVLCNAPGTFQRCMMEVFMDEFLVFWNSFGTCLSHLDKMLKRCEDTNLCLNWEKSHFMVKEGIVLGHNILKNEIEVDKAKVDVIAKLPHSTTVKGIRSFLGHAGNGYSRKRQKQGQKRQNQTQNGKDRKRQSHSKPKSQKSKPEFPANFVVVDFEPDLQVPLILGRCFLKTGRALIDVHKGELTLRIGNEAITYNLDQTVRYSANYNKMTANKIDVIYEIYSQEVLGFSNDTASGSPTPDDDPIVSITSPTLTPFGDSDFLLFEEADAFLGLEDDLNSSKISLFYYDLERDILLLEAILNSEPLPPIPNHEQYL
nr:reverse transcriptase domain-containing protein [Tanacetum cinerariifolium]